ncbi:MAG: hypothetical protein LRY62_01370 [Alphaproteobacteria bacterium]|nr:hypothetical protein [Alphaproteobacteria bacterium]
MKLKIQKRWIVVFTISFVILLLSFPIITMFIPNEGHKRISEFRVFPILVPGVSVEWTMSYLDTLGFKDYYLRFKDYCGGLENKHFYRPKYNNEYVSSECYKIDQIALHIATWTLIEGDVIFVLNYNENEEFESYSDRVGWTFI